MNVALFGNIHRTASIEQARRVIEILSSRREVNVLIEDKFHDVYTRQYPTQEHVCPLRLLNGHSIDIAFSIGGDGTFLRTAAFIADRGTPIVGINCGRLGFLADVSTDEVEAVVESVIAGTYIVEERTLLQVITNDNSGEGLPYALNEVAILKQDLSSMITIETHINDEYVLTYQSDGLIIATPTGSTAYSMSVGGPILVPQAHNLVISPVASHSLNVRPLVVPDSWSVSLKVASRSASYLVSIDGRSQVLDDTTELTIRKAPYMIRIVKPDHHTFFNTLKNKLFWGADMRKS